MTLLERVSPSSFSQLENNIYVSSNGATKGRPDPALFTPDFDLEAALDDSSFWAAGQYILPRLYIETSWFCVGFESWLCVGRR
jgi:hypothetical protein